MDVPTLNLFLRALSQVPYLASKNIYRVADYFLHMSDDQMVQFCHLLMQLKKNVVACETCFAWKERNRLCVFCSENRHDQSVLCVVESWQDLLSIEKTDGYRGLYHVLGGVICPLEGVGPEVLKIEELVQRVVHSQTIKEVILAISQTAEGEATAAYIARKLQDTGVLITALARGMPIGSSPEAMDRLTIYRALSDRRPW